MYADLNFPYEGSWEPRRMAPLFAAARQHGYSVVASNYIAAVPLRPKDACKANDVALDGPAPSSASSSSSAAAAAQPLDLVAAMAAHWGSRLTKGRRAGGGGSAAAVSTAGRKRKRDESGGDDGAGASSSSSAAAARPPPPPPPFTQLTRITVAVPTGRQAAEVYPGHPVLSSYDIVAVAPGDAEALRAVASSGAVDIVCLDMTSGRLPFGLRADVVAAVLGSGAVFELEFAPAIRDANLRRFFAANAAALLRLTRGRGVLLSSGAKSALEVRNPRDAAAIGALGGLTPDRGLAALGGAGAGAVIAHAEARHAARGRGGGGPAGIVHTLPTGGGGKGGGGGTSAGSDSPSAAAAGVAAAAAPKLAGLGARGVSLAAAARTKAGAASKPAR